MWKVFKVRGMTFYISESVSSLPEAVNKRWRWHWWASNASLAGHLHNPRRNRYSERADNNSSRRSQKRKNRPFFGSTVDSVQCASAICKPTHSKDARPHQRICGVERYSPGWVQHPWRHITRHRRALHDKNTTRALLQPGRIRKGMQLFFKVRKSWFIFSHVL